MTKPREKFARLAKPSDMVLTMGAGSVSQLGPLILEQLNEEAGRKRATVGVKRTAKLPHKCMCQHVFTYVTYVTFGNGKDRYSMRRHAEESSKIF